MTAFLEALADQGYTIEQTGGGCTTLHRSVDQDSFYWITADGDAAAPTSMDEAVLVGYYWNHGDAWRLFAFTTLYAALSWIDRHPHGVARVYSDVPEHPTLITPGVGADDPAFS